MVCLFINLFLSFLKHLFNFIYLSICLSIYLFKLLLTGFSYFEGIKHNLENWLIVRVDCFVVVVVVVFLFIYKLISFIVKLFIQLFCLYFWGKTNILKRKKNDIFILPFNLFKSLLKYVFFIIFIYVF